MAEWRVLVAETLTGTIVADVLPSKFPAYERGINERGSWSVSVLVHQSTNSAVDLHTFTQTGKYSWVIAYGNHIAQAGPVWSYQFDDASGELTVTGSSLGSFLGKRVLRNPNGHTAIVDPSEDLVYANRSLRGIMRALVLDSLNQDGYMLPLDLPLTETGEATRTYFGYDLATVWDRMEDLSKVIDGPEFDFQPYFVPNTNYVRWQMLIGGPLLGNQQTPAVWDYGGALGSIDVDVNGSASPAARVWVKGSGTDRSLMTGFAEDTSLVAQGFPPIDYVDTEHTSVIEQPTLESYADADLKAFRWPTEQWTCSVRIDGRSQETGVELSPALGNWQLGDAPTFHVSGHPWLADGGYRRRILGYASEGPEHVSLKLAESASTQ